MAELNRIKLRLLGNYNSLMDEHLADYFSNPRIRKHLIKAGLVRQNGTLVSPEDYKARVLEEQRWLASQAFLAQAIVQRALDMEFNRRAQLQRHLEEIIRLELVERVRSARQKHQPSTRSQTPNVQADLRRQGSSRRRRQTISSSYRRQASAGERRKVSSATYSDTFDDESGSSSASTDIENHSSSDFALRNSQNKSRTTGSASSRFREKAASPYSISVVHGRSKPISRTRSASYCMKSRANTNRRGILPLKHNNYSYCEVTLKFLGTRSFAKSSIKGGRQDVVIKQQFSGGNPNIVFSESISPGSTFSFTSRRYAEFPFNATIYVDSIVVLRLSACCEYKYHVGYRLGGPQGYFVLVGVRGMKPCHKCGAGRKNETFLPPVSHKLVQGKTISFKPSDRKLAWSNRQNFAEKQVALITPSEKLPNASQEKMLNSNDNSQWVLSVGLSSWSEDGRVSSPGSPKKENEVDALESSFKTLTVDKVENDDDEEEIAEEIVTDADPMKTDDKNVIEIDDASPMQQNLNSTQLNVNNDETESGTIDSESSSSSDETDSGSSESEISSEVSKQTAIEGPEITVSKPATPDSESGSSSYTSNGSSYTGSDTEDSAEIAVEHRGQFLKPEDANRPNKKHDHDLTPQKFKTRDLNVSNSLHVESSKQEKIALIRPADVPFDSSDDDDVKSEPKTQVVKADVHAEPEKDATNVSMSSGTSIDSTSKELVRQHSISSNGVAPNLMKRNSLTQVLSRTVSEDADRDSTNGKDSLESSVQDNGSEIEIISQNISGQISELCEELQHRPELTTLTISKGGIDDLNIGRIIDALIRSKCPLKSLNLNYNHLGPQAGQQIARLVKAKPTLKSLYLRANPLHDSGLCPIVEALLQNNSAFHLPQEVSRGLQKLDVGECTFRNEGATNLASLIEQSLGLETLILTGNNQLNDDDWSSIFWAVGHNPSVTTLFLDYCYLGDEGIDCLTNVIQDHPALEAIDLEWNQVSDEGAKWLINWIKQSPKLNQVRIESGNGIKETYLADIKKALDRKLK